MGHFKCVELSSIGATRGGRYQALMLLDRRAPCIALIDAHSKTIDATRRFPVAGVPSGLTPRQAHGKTASNMPSESRAHNVAVSA
jgi:hypothetical protein